MRPLTELDPNNLPTFAWVVPNHCNDMHDCSVGTGDTWLQQHLQPVLDSAAYKSGSVLVEIWFDEDHPVPNLLLNPAIPAGVDTTTAPPTSERSGCGRTCSASPTSVAPQPPSTSGPRSTSPSRRSGPPSRGLDPAPVGRAQRIRDAPPAAT